MNHSESTSSVGDSPVRIFPTPAQGQDLAVPEADSFSRPFAWFSNCDLESLCWKTWQRCLLGDWTEFSGRWPRSGMMRNGIAFRLRPLVPRTQGTEVSLLPTPTAMDSYADLSAAQWSGCAPYVNGVKRNTDLAQFLKVSGREDLANLPEFREWMMSFPLGWTCVNTVGSSLTDSDAIHRMSVTAPGVPDCANAEPGSRDSETPLFPRSPNGSADES